MPLSPDLRRILVEAPRRVALFGSEAHGEAAEGSDVDVLVALSAEVEAAVEAWRRGAEG